MLERKISANTLVTHDLQAGKSVIDPSKVRRSILAQSKRANVGHIGSALSIVEILCAIYGSAMRIGAEHADRDRFVLSKGHAVLALYCVLKEMGVIDEAQLDTFCGNGSLLGGHPEHALGPIDFTTGSLGQGLTYAVGCALAAKRQGSERKVYAVISDAECNEGCMWEAAMFAAHHRLDNLFVCLDFNGQQALGYTREVLDQTNIAERWRAFGWDTVSVDGHDVKSLTSALSSAADGNGAPHMIVANTTFGKGVSFMHNKIEWHYFPLNETQFAQAIQEVGGPQ